MDVSVPDVVVEEENSTPISPVEYVAERKTKTVNSTSTVGGGNLQLAVDVETTPRNKSPVTVQEWVDSLPLNLSETKDESDSHVSIMPTAVVDSETVTDAEADNLTLGAEAVHLCEPVDDSPLPSPPVNVTVTSCREPSEVESHCSSVDSLLEARKPDPEEILLSLGFGGTASSNYLETGRIPKRFLNPSQLKGVNLDEFIRQQQDLIYTFESGYYGYRGLAGPSHSNPSEIVGRILEKLRDHEKENSSISSYQPDFKKRSSIDKSPDNKPRKFSKVARNVLTKIRCTPGSVLSPDNRRWLDSQGNKSPEINRRLIIGQKSFTFGNDGDLIESSTNGGCESNVKCAEKEDSTERQTPILTVEPDQDSSSLEIHDGDGYNGGGGGGGGGDEKLDYLPTDSSTDEQSMESMIAIRRRSAQSCRLSREPSINLEDVPEMTENGTASRDETLRLDGSVDEETCSSLATNRLTSTVNSLPECENEFKAADNVKDTNKKIRNPLKRCSSFDESVEMSSREIRTSVDGGGVVGRPLSERGEHFSDSATESEIASYADRANAFSQMIRKQYDELMQLESLLHVAEPKTKSLTEEQFVSFTLEQRMLVQSKIVRDALKLYLHRFTEDDINLELKNCLTAEAQKVADLLDICTDTSKLCIIVRQMRLLLQHQSQLSARLKELSTVDTKPSSCHEMCGHLMERVQDLELLVEQNTKELAQMKHQLLQNKNDRQAKSDFID